MRGKRGKRRKPVYKLIPPERRREESPFSSARIVPAPVRKKEKTASPLKPDPKISTVAVKNIWPGKPYEQRTSSAQKAKKKHAAREAENTRSIVLPNHKASRSAFRNPAQKPAHLRSNNDHYRSRLNSSRKKPLRTRLYILISISACVSVIILLGIMLIPGILHNDTTTPQLLTTPYVLSAEDGVSPLNSSNESTDSISAVVPTPENNLIAAQPSPSESAAPSPTAEPTASATQKATSKSTPSPTAASTPTPTATPTPTPTAAPTPTPTAAPTPTPTAAPTPTPTAAPTPTPTAAPTPTPTAAPTPTPTTAPTPEPTASPPI